MYLVSSDLTLFVFVLILCCLLACLSSILTVSFPTAKPGRVLGPFLPYENGRSINTYFDPRIFHQNTLPLAGCPDCFYEVQLTDTQNTMSETYKVFSQGKHQNPSQQCNLPARPAVDLNPNPYHQQAKMNGFDSSMISIDAKLLQAQSQFGVAAVAVTAYRHSGAVQYGLS